MGAHACTGVRWHGYHHFRLARLLRQLLRVETGVRYSPMQFLGSLVVVVRANCNRGAYRGTCALCDSCVDRDLDKYF